MSSDGPPKVLAIIPVRGMDAEVEGAPVILGDRPLIAYTIKSALQSLAVSRTVVTTDSSGVSELAKELGAEAPFLRPSQLVGPDVSLDQVLQHCVAWLEDDHGYSPDIVLSMEIFYPMRPPELPQQVTGALTEQQLDTVVTVMLEKHPIWREDEYGELGAIGGEETAPRPHRRPLYRQLAGLALACRGDLLLREGRRFGRRVGVVPLQDPYAGLDVQEPLGLRFAEFLLTQDPASLGG